MPSTLQRGQGHTWWKFPLQQNKAPAQSVDLSVAYWIYIHIKGSFKVIILWLTLSHRGIEEICQGQKALKRANELNHRNLPQSIRLWHAFNGRNPWAPRGDKGLKELNVTRVNFTATDSSVVSSRHEFNLGMEQHVLQHAANEMEE